MRQFLLHCHRPKRRRSERDRDAQTLGRPSRDALHSWRELIGLGFGAAIGLWAEWWSGEVLIVLSGMLCTQDVSAMLSQKGAEDNAALDVGTCTGGAVTAALWNTGATCWLIHGGFAIATPTRMGNALGAGDAEAARFSAKVGATLQTLVGATASLALFVGRYRYGELFSLEGEALALMGTLMPLANVVQLGIAAGCGALRSILTGLTIVSVPAVVQVVAFWPIALLLGYTLAFKAGLGVVGLWVGEAIGYAVMVAGLSVVMGRVDWQKKAQEAKMRASKDHSVYDAVAEDDFKIVGDLELDEGEQAQLLHNMPSSALKNPPRETSPRE